MSDNILLQIAMLISQLLCGNILQNSKLFLIFTISKVNFSELIFSCAILVF